MLTVIDLPSNLTSLYEADFSCSYEFIPTLLESSSAIAPIVTLSTILSKVYSYVSFSVLLSVALFPSTVTCFKLLLLFSL